ncbi:MAG: tRNA pseudouridine(38-40) synthase TruA [Candidatus Aminicenantales bacterium]
MTMQNYVLRVCYDGTDYHGWQRQPNKRTIQGTLENAVFRLARKKVPIIGAGRTDAGVHARAQVANFKADLKLKEKELLRALNALLPEDIRIVSLKKTGPAFHARKSAKSKVYEYRIFLSPQINPFVLRYVLHWPYALNVQKMSTAARLFCREADFSGFSSNRLLHPVRKVIRSEIKKRGGEIVYTIEANGFLRYMVRTIVGTLLEVGRGKIPPQKIEDIFREKKRTLSSPTAPAKGLSLVKVIY